jgi:DNA-binding XRE family transcriptional regulator
MIRPVINVDGKRYVVIEERELQRLELSATKTGALSDSGAGKLPPLPPADKHGNRPAVAFAQASIARSIIRDRQAAGLSQQELARLAGVRQETISRLESGKHSPTIRTVEKIDRVLRQSLKSHRKRSHERRGK